MSVFGRGVVITAFCGYVVIVRTAYAASASPAVRLAAGFDFVQPFGSACEQNNYDTTECGSGFTADLFLAPSFRFSPYASIGARIGHAGALGDLGSGIGDRSGRAERSVDLWYSELEAHGYPLGGSRRASPFVGLFVGLASLRESHESPAARDAVLRHASIFGGAIGLEIPVGSGVFLVTEVRLQRADFTGAPPRLLDGWATQYTRTSSLAYGLQVMGTIGP